MARSRAHASELITAGSVSVGGLTEPKPASLVGPDDPISTSAEPPRYVGRGGLKLEGAMEAFGIDPAGARCLDAGASTGGFTDYLLQQGAASVDAVDVGRGQLVSKIAKDPRVTVHDRTNIRLADPAVLGGRFELIVADLSFISLCAVAAKLAELSEMHASLVLLVKPQFEVGKGKVGKGGVVSDPGLRRESVAKVIECLAENGIGAQAVAPSPVPGAKGNREYFVWAIAGEAPAPNLEIPE